MTMVFQKGAILKAEELNGVLATKADLDSVTGKVRADQMPDIGAIVGEQLESELDAIRADVATRATQAGLDELAAFLVEKASADELAALAVLLDGKADASTVASLQASLAGKASAEALAALAASVPKPGVRGGFAPLETTADGLKVPPLYLPADLGGGVDKDLTPPKAASFTRWVRQTEPTGSWSVSPGGGSTLVDTEFGLLVDNQIRQNDMWVIRFFGRPLPAGYSTWRHTVGIEFVEPGYSPFVVYGPMLLREASLKGVWSHYWHSRGEPLSSIEAASTVLAEGGSTPSNWSTLSVSRRAISARRVFFEHTIDAEGYLTSRASLRGPRGPWQLLHQGLLDAAMGEGGTGNKPSHVGFAMGGLQEGTPLVRQRTLVIHESSGPYTGPARPSSWQ